MLGEEGGYRLGLVSREVIDDEMGFAVRGGVASTFSRKAMNSVLVCWALVLPSTSPVAVLSAASSESVPWRKDGSHDARPGQARAAPCKRAEKYPPLTHAARLLNDSLAFAVALH
jgi:hypothetical protein